MNARAKQLAEIGSKTYRSLVPVTTAEGYALIQAIAAMLAAPVATKPKPDRPKLAFTAQALHEALKSRVSHLVVTDFVNGAAFGAANKRLHDLPNLTAEDLPLLVDWIEAGGFAWMTQSAPTFQMVAYKIEQWLNNARDWDRKGRPVLGKQGAVTGAPVRDVGGSFK